MAKLTSSNNVIFTLKNKHTTDRLRINATIRAKELRVINAEGANLGILSLEDALEKAKESGLDLIEISPNAKPPIAKIMDYGRYKYEEGKKQKKSKQQSAETKVIQIKIGTGEHDLALKAKKASEWLKEGHRIQLELFLVGRTKYMDETFLKDRMKRILALISEPYKMAHDIKKGPKGFVTILEKETKKPATPTEEKI
jgi:translation initiation factor IF-3